MSKVQNDKVFLLAKERELIKSQPSLAAQKCECGALLPVCDWPEGEKIVCWFCHLIWKASNGKWDMAS